MSSPDASNYSSNQATLSKPAAARVQPNPTHANVAAGTSKPLFDNQAKTVELLEKEPITFDTSDPGTGKTRAHLEAWIRSRHQGGGKLLVLAPKSILESAWVGDLERFYGKTFLSSVALASNRRKAFERYADIYITNSDAVKWLAGNTWALEGFEEIVVDESTAFKNHNSQRSKALNDIRLMFDKRRALTGTPHSRTILEIWNQVHFLDGIDTKTSDRLGSFWNFRRATCNQEPVPGHPTAMNWTDKPDIEIAVAQLISDITIRHKFEDCHDIPKNHVRHVQYHMPRQHAAAYNEMKEYALLEHKEGNITAANAAVLRNKLLQVASGAVYGAGEHHQLLDTGRYELINDLIDEVDHSVVFFLWTHQRNELIREAKKRGISYEIIDGSVPERRRTRVVEAYQQGDLRTVFLHPQSAAHGLTLTRGRRTIWCSPTAQPDLFKQGNHRIYRAGQSRRTETILVEAVGTLERQVYETLDGRKTRMFNLLDMF